MNREVLNSHMAKRRVKTVGVGRWVIGAACILLLAGCAGSASFRKGEKLMILGELDAAVRAYGDAVAADPTEIEYKVRYIQAREAAAFQHEKEGERSMERGDVEGAIRSFQQALDLDPSYKQAERRLMDAREQRRSSQESGAASPRASDDGGDVQEPSAGGPGSVAAP